jgi:hypothetical protein
VYGLNTGVGLYLPGQGHTHMGPGTSFVQRIDWTRAQENEMRGFGCTACGGNCGKCGLGLFDSGLDFSQWGPVEWLLIAAGGYVALSTLFTTQRATRRVRKSFKRYARRRASAE